MPKVLIVENEESIGLWICSELEEFLGISPVLETDCEEALSLLTHEKFDLIIFEPFISGPKKENLEERSSKGIRVFHEITWRFKEVPVILYSAYSLDYLARLGLNQTDSVIVIGKSSNLSELLFRICDLLQIEKPIYPKTVLLIVPEEDIGQLYKEELEGFLLPFSIQLIYSKDYDDALVLLSHKNFSLIVIDVDCLDGRDNPEEGIDTFYKITQEYKQTPIIVTSFLPREFASKLQGANLVLKSTDLTSLKLRICDVLGIENEDWIRELIGISPSLRNKVKIFICYAKEDFNRVHAIYRRLKIENYSPWMDKKNLIGGQDWELEIAKAMDECKFFLACLSKHSVSKEGYVQKELKKGLEIYDRHPEGNIFLIPVRLDDCRVPERFKKLHWINLYEPNGIENLLTAIEVGCKQRGILSY
jgi:CheY-like chemotaxis protein